MMEINTYLIHFSEAMLISLLQTMALWSVYSILKFIFFKQFIERPLFPMILSYASLCFIGCIWIVNIYQVFWGNEIMPHIVNVMLDNSISYIPNLNIRIINWLALISSLYYVVCFVHKLRLFKSDLKNIIQLHKLTNAQYQIQKPDWIKQVFNNVCMTINARTKPIFILATSKIGPLTLSIVKPIVIYPIAALTALTPEETASVLTHELNHIKHFDFYLNFLCKLISLLLPFNPWIGKWIQEIQFLQEVNCDQKVLKSHKRKIYTEALIKIADYQQVAMASSAQASLLQRVKYMYGEYPSSLNVLRKLKNINTYWNNSALHMLIVIIVIALFTSYAAKSDYSNETLQSTNNVLNLNKLIHLPKKLSLATPSLRVNKMSPTNKTTQPIKKKQAFSSDQTNTTAKVSTGNVISNIDFKLINVNALTANSKEIKKAKEQIINLSLWMLNHKHFAPDLMNINELTPEEFSLFINEYNNDISKLSAQVRMQVNEMQNVEEIATLAKSVYKKVMYLLYLETIDEDLQNDSIH